MSTILDKKAMTEEDIKLQYITPAIIAKWNIKKITMETQITDGKVNLKGNLIIREKPKRADYILYLNANNPIAVIEAKDNNHSISFGLQQAMAYAQMLDLPFAYSSNGDGFTEHDFLTGKEREFGLDEFPSEDELIARYKQERALKPEQEAVIDQPYYSSQTTYPPRYYQRIAVNRTVDAIARGQDRLLLVMATGTGKTYTAFQIVYRLLQTGMKHKILYLADRNILVDQSIQQDFAPLEKVIQKPLPVIAEEKIPFDIPESWKWVRWGEIVNIVSARRVHQSDWKKEGIPFFRAREIAKLATDGYVENELFISQELFDEFSKSGVPKEGDLMVTAVGTLGKTYIVKATDYFYYKDASVICFENFAKVCPKYLKYMMESELMKSQIQNNSSGTTVATLTMVRMVEYLIPLPPLAEQKRIVAKLEEILPLCERLK